MSSRCVSSCDNRRSSISDSFSSCRNNTTFLPHLELGDVGTSLDMTIEPNMYKALKKANFLLAHDFAFVLRSNGQWTYAMVAHRGPIGTSDGEEDALLFVLDMKGSTKKLSRKHWSSCIRMVNTNALSNSYICWSNTHIQTYMPWRITLAFGASIGQYLDVPMSPHVGHDTIQCTSPKNEISGRRRPKYAQHSGRNHNSNKFADEEDDRHPPPIVARWLLVRVKRASALFLALAWLTSDPFWTLTMKFCQLCHGRYEW